MGTDISKGEIGVAQSTFKNAPKVMFFPQTQNAILSRPPHPPRNVGKQDLGAGLRASNQHSSLRGGCGGRHAALALCHFFRRKKCAIFARFFRDHSVNVLESPQPFFF